MRSNRGNAKDNHQTRKGSIYLREFLPCKCKHVNILLGYEASVSQSLSDVRLILSRFTPVMKRGIHPGTCDLTMLNGSTLGWNQEKPTGGEGGEGEEGDKRVIRGRVGRGGRGRVRELDK